jgi:hypothetical protein
MNTRRFGPAVVMAALAITLAAPAAASAASPLAGWWPMNERSGQTVYDWSGNGNHGRLGSTPGVDDNDPTWIKGIFNLGSALRFDGNDFVTIPDSAALRSAQLTVSAWFRGERTPGSFRYLVSKGADGCEASSYALYTSASEGLGFYIYDGSAWKRSPEAGASVWDGRWHHAAGTWDGQRPRLYIDGKLIAGGNVSYETIQYDLDYQDAALGAYRGDCELMFAGAIDQVMIWKKPIEVDKIWQRWGWFLGQPNSG